MFETAEKNDEVLTKKISLGVTGLTFLVRQWKCERAERKQQEKQRELHFWMLSNLREQKWFWLFVKRLFSSQSGFRTGEMTQWLCWLAADSTVSCVRGITSLTSVRTRRVFSCMLVYKFMDDEVWPHWEELGQCFLSIDSHMLKAVFGSYVEKLSACEFESRVESWEAFIFGRRKWELIGVEWSKRNSEKTKSVTKSNHNNIDQN